MPNGRGRGGAFYGRRFVPQGLGAYGYRGYTAYGTPYLRGGRGNPFPFCRNFPWLPRWWWATPYAAQYAGTLPYPGAYPYPQPAAYPAGQLYPSRYAGPGVGF